MVTTTTTDTITHDILPLAMQRIRHNVGLFADRFPSYGDGDHRYILTPNQNWLASFWAGLLWLVYDHSGDPADAQAASALLPSFAARLDQGVRLNHDLGFLFTLSARAQYRLTGNESAKALALRAADVLYQRYRPAGQYIQAWGEADDPAEAGRFIIDCMMNLPLLFWASQQTGQPHYYDAALAHARTSQQYLLRPDGATYHTYVLNPADGTPIGAKTHQGYADNSLWARGQGWAVYGFTMAAEWTNDDSFIASAKSAAQRYLADAPLTAVTPYDLRLPADAPAPPDSSADAIVAAGLLRLAALTADDTYRQQAADLLMMLNDNAFDHRPQAQGLLLHGTQHAPHAYGVDTYTIFGDYFFLEALLRLLGTSSDFWGQRQKGNA